MFYPDDHIHAADVADPLPQPNGYWEPEAAWAGAYEAYPHHGWVEGYAADAFHDVCILQ
jgi:hypothetical protein